MPGSIEPSATRPPFQTTTPGVQITPIPTGAPAAVPPAKWDAIVADLTAHGVTATPTLVSSEAVTWNSSALGCPQPGNSYTQALVDGMRIIVKAGDKEYDYRFGKGDIPLLCTR